MEPSPQPPESPAKVADNAEETHGMARFKALAGKLFALDPLEFRKARIKDEQERRLKRDS